MASYWIESTNNIKQFEKLNQDIQADVCIVGGGITGISTAYKLCKKGLKVVILEKDNICSNTTGNTTGKITSFHGLFYKYLSDSFSLDFAKGYLDANEQAILDINNIIKDEFIECDFEIQDNYIFTNDSNDIQKIKDEVSTINSLNGNAEFVTTSPLPFEIKGAIKVKNQAQFHPVKYSLGLCKSILKNNGQIYSNTKVYDIKQENDKYITSTENYTVTSKYIVIASHYPILNYPGFYFLKMYQERSYIIGVDLKQDVFNGMYISTSHPSISFRNCKTEDKKILLVCGSKHKTGQNEIVKNSYTNLEEYIKSIYPNSEILYRWSTQDCISLDKIPYIGEFSSLTPNMYIATGFKKWGMSTSNIASTLITDKIINRQNPYEDIFQSTRFHPLKNHDELFNMIKQTAKSLVVDKLLLPKDIGSDLSEGEGKIVELDNKKIGMCKINNKIFTINPICSHLGCELTFNDLDKTWDCPCHGSRFDFEGKSISEPSIKDLDRYN